MTKTQLVALMGNPTQETDRSNTSTHRPVVLTWKGDHPPLYWEFDAYFLNGIKAYELTALQKDQLSCPEDRKRK